MPYGILRKRREFLRLTKEGRRLVTPFFIVQALVRHEIADEAREELGKFPIRLGITASKKIGGAVERNRAKRRLRALFRDSHLHYPQKNIDIVLIARKIVLTAPFSTMKYALEQCLKELNV